MHVGERPALVYTKIHEGYCARSKKPAINSRGWLIGSGIIRRFGKTVETKRRKGRKRNRSTAKSDCPVARRVTISVGLLASTRTKNKESPIQGPRARMSYGAIISVFVRTREGATPCRKMARARFCLARPIRESRFSSSIDEDEGGQFVSPHGARPQKPGTTGSSRLTAARRKDDDGDDRVMTLPFCPCFFHAKIRLPRIQFFIGPFRTSLVTTRSRTNRGKWRSLETIKMKRIFMQRYWVTDSVSSGYWCLLMRRQKSRWISKRRFIGERKIKAGLHPSKANGNPIITHRDQMSMRWSPFNDHLFLEFRAPDPWKF